MNRTFTAGYSGRTPAQIQRATEQLDAVVVDIRYSPNSRQPGWSRRELEALLGDRYAWLRELGNTNYNGLGPIRLANLSGGMVRLSHLRKSSGRSVILLCGCADYETCHRRTVAELMAQGGWDVQEIAWPELETAGGMKALSLWQPWASLIAVGAKRIETRSWSTSYRGPLAIHAAKTTVELDSCVGSQFWSAFRRAGLLCVPEPENSHLSEWHQRQTFLNLSAKRKLEWLPLPLGALVAVCDLVDCVPTGKLSDTLSDQERAFGDYGSGRFGWILENVRALPEPVPCKGARQLFDVDVALLKERS